MHRLRIGIAGWSIPAARAGCFPPEGSHLERYSQRFPAVEINSSFYRPHRPGTYKRWAASVPPDFRFAVKVPKEITHTRRLVGVVEPLTRFLDETSALGEKLGPLLIQTPPSLAFDEGVCVTFFQELRTRFDGAVAFELRHRTWLTDQADALLTECRVARVAADPALMPRAAEPGGWTGLRYYRLHGSPRMYYSPYSPAFLAELHPRLIANSQETWCIFDNTAEGAAINDALTVWRAR